MLSDVIGGGGMRAAQRWKPQKQIDAVFDVL
jgi:hypothetical protein